MVKFQKIRRLKPNENIKKFPKDKKLQKQPKGHNKMWTIIT